MGFGQSQERAQRLVQLSAALGLGSPRTLEELRDRFGIYADVATRAMQKKFERDRADLADAGIHVEPIRLGDDHAYWIRRRTAPLELTDVELDVLAVLTATIGDPTTGAALATLAGEAGRFPADHAAGRVAIDVTVPDELTLALTQRRRLRAAYRDATGAVADRTFEPWQLVHRRGLTYVVAWDVERDGERNFRLDRFQGNLQEAGLAQHERPDSPSGPVYPVEQFDFVLDAPESAKFDAAELGGSVRTNGDGRVRVEFVGYRSEPILSWALRHHATMAAPTEFTSQLEARLQRLLERHDGTPTPVDVPPTPKARTQTLSVERVRRLMVLPSYLGELHGMTRDELAGALGCSRAELDVELELLDTLELPGHGPVGEVVEDRGQLVYTRHVHRPQVELLPADALRLLLHLEVLTLLLGSEEGGLASLRDKLRRFVPAEIRVELAGEHHLDLPLLRGAMAERQVVRFEYKGRKDLQWRVRQVTPDQFRVANGALYLAGVDVALGEERQYRLDRMGPVELVGTVPVLAAESVVPAYVATEPEIEVVLLLDHAARWVLVHVATVAVAQHEDGTTVAVLRTDALEWLLSHVRAAGGGAEIVSPPDVRARVAAEAREVLGT